MQVREQNGVHLSGILTLSTCEPLVVVYKGFERKQVFLHAPIAKLAIVVAACTRT